MAYTKQTWQDLPSKTTPINASRLGHIEQGIYDAASTADDAASNASSAISGLADKVDKVEGKGLSTNDFTDALKTKLDNIEAGAEVNVQADYAQTDTTADDYIKNKPSLGTASSKNSTSVVTDSTDLVESGAVKDAIVDTVGWIGGNRLSLANLGYDALSNISYNVSGGIVYVTKSATSDRTSIGIFNQTYIDDVALSLKGKTITITGGKSDDKYIQWWDDVNGVKQDKGTGITFEFPATASSFNLQLIFTANATASNEPFYLQAEIGSQASAFKPYHESVEKTKADNSVIAPVENGSTASQAYAVGQHFIRDGAFCTVTSAISANESLAGSNKFSSRDVADAITDLENGLISSTQPWSGNTLTFPMPQNNGVMYRLTAMNTNGLHYVDTILVNRVDGIPKHDFGEAITCSYSGENLVITLPTTDYYMYKMEQIKYGTK